MNDQLKKAAIYSLVSWFMLASGIVVWKAVMSDYSISQILAIEAMVLLPLFLGMAKIKGGLHLLKTSYPVLQILRGIFQTLAAYLGLYGLLYLPISTYTMLGYCTPFIITLAAWLFLKEKCPVTGWVCIALGFVGTALILQPEYTQNLVAALAIILSCCFYAGNVILMKKMPKDHVMSFPFYTVLVCGMVSFIILMFIGITPMSVFDFSAVSIAGVLFFIGAQILFATYRLAPLHFLTPFQYTEIVWVVTFGYLLWRETPTTIQIAGLVIVIFAAIYSSFSQKDIPQVEPTSQ